MSSSVTVGSEVVPTYATLPFESSRGLTRLTCVYRYAATWTSMMTVFCFFAEIPIAA